MHQTLLIPEILLSIFGESYEQKADLAALARTCRAFTQPALDVLWEELSDLSPLARCLPGACYKSDTENYSFSRPLNEAEWNTLRAYARRVWSIHRFRSLDKSAFEVVFTQGPFTGPLFPNLRRLLSYSAALPVVHTAVPSLTFLQLGFPKLVSPSMKSLDAVEFLDAVGERCPSMKIFILTSPRFGLGATISRQLRRWTNLQCARCYVSLDADTILRLPSTPTLKELSFRLSADSKNITARLGSPCTFPNLAKLDIRSKSLKTITNLFTRIQLPRITDLTIRVSLYVPKQELSVYWATVQKMCPPSTLVRLELSSSGRGINNWIGPGEQRPRLTLDDLLPYKDFGNLHEMAINVAWSVKLTDVDLLDLVSTSPQLQRLSINAIWGWKMGGDGGGITFSGLVQLLQQCPLLTDVALAIDAQTFTQIPQELDVKLFSQRRLRLHCLDSYVAPESLLDLESVFATLGVNDSRFSFDDF